MYAADPAEKLTQDLMVSHGRGNSSSSSSNAIVREASAHRSSRAGILGSYRRLLRLRNILQQLGWPLWRAWCAASLQGCQLPSVLHQLPCKLGTGALSSGLEVSRLMFVYPQGNR